MSRVLPILFNMEMVRAILDGRKTVTRRVVKYKYSNTVMEMFTNKYGTRLIEIQQDVEGETYGKHPDGRTWHKIRPYIEKKAPYKRGDILYVRETWRVGAWDIRNQMIAFDYRDGTCGKLVYISDRDLFERLVNQSREDARKAKCEYNGVDFVWEKGKSPCRWRPSIHMPKEAARIWLKVTDVRVEQLKEILNDPPGPNNQIVKEGCRYGSDFIAVWENTVKKTERDMYGWNANPWVWVIEFERCEKPAKEG